MDRITLREAAERSARSITTLRRYIRSGRLHAEKRCGRFGPEYFVSVRDLAEAGLDPESRQEAAALAPRPSTDSLVRRSAAPVLQDAVPLALYQELQMKHEQLLVQYGMVRAGGLRAMELKGELEAERKQFEALQHQLEQRLLNETARLRRQLREAQLELEGRALEISALQEKVRGLEMLTRNAVTNETIEKQFSRVMAQSRRVDRLSAGSDWDDVGPDH
jgi:hypothetical protein